MQYEGEQCYEEYDVENLVGSLYVCYYGVGGEDDGDCTAQADP